MDRTQACGVCDRGSIPLEGTANIVSEHQEASQLLGLREESKDGALLRSNREVGSRKFLKEIISDRFLSRAPERKLQARGSRLASLGD